MENVSIGKEKQVDIDDDISQKDENKLNEHNTSMNEADADISDSL